MLASLGNQLDVQGGYVVYASLPPVTWRQEMLDSDYAVEANVRLLLRALASLDVAKLAVSASIHRDVQVEAHPWNAATEKVVMQFFPSDRSKQKQSKRLMSMPVPYGFLFDLHTARAGTPNAISPAFQHLLCYARARLDAHYHEHYSLHALDGNDAFYRRERDLAPHGMDDARQRGL